MIMCGVPSDVQKQLSEALTIICKYDFPGTHIHLILFFREALTSIEILNKLFPLPYSLHSFSEVGESFAGYGHQVCHPGFPCH